MTDAELCTRVVVRVEVQRPGLLSPIAQEDGMTKEQLVEKVLRISRGELVCTHQFGACVSLSQGVFVVHGRCDALA